MSLTTAGDIAAGDTNAHGDVFVWGRRNGPSVRAGAGGAGAPAVKSAGGRGPGISADGRRVAFVSVTEDLVPGDIEGCEDVFVRPARALALALALARGATVRASGAHGGQAPTNFGAPALSADGGHVRYGPALAPDARVVAFGSSAADLVPPETNDLDDVLARTALLPVPSVPAPAAWR